MGTSRPWRQQLLGSLQGQLQLTTYLAVFLGFTGASVAGLWVGQRNLIDSAGRDLQQSAGAIATSLLESEEQTQSVRRELLLHSSLRRQLWLERSDGQLLLPRSDRLPLTRDTIQIAMNANPQRVVGRRQRM